MDAMRETSLARKLLAALFAVVLLAGCASDPDIRSEQLAQADQGFSDIDVDIDPLEGLNRFFFAINDMLDTVAFRPLAATYRVLLPQFFRDAVQSFLRNLDTPVTLGNDLLQGSFDRAGTTLMRFAINTTVGVAGLWDAADNFGYPYHKEDFGQTLGVWGVGPYPYLVLPVFGPSTARDGIGLAADTFMDPLFYLLPTELSLARTAVQGIDFRSRNIETIEELRRDSIDFYARIRSVYLQRRVDEINNGETPDDESPAPGLSGDVPGESQFSIFDDWPEEGSAEAE